LKACDPPVGEAWIAFAESRVQAGAHAGQTVAELASRYGADFLGAESAARFGARFPLLIKLLDCADWLSVQVHPNDEQARRLVAPDEFGKTEAWHFLAVEQGATIIAGVKPGTSQEALAAAIRAGNILEVARRFEVRTGETYLLPAGTLHSLGPGLLLYEVQQASDTTFRVYDWGRPLSAGRQLHIEESVAVTDARQSPVPSTTPVLNGTAAAPLVSCPFFALEALRLADSSLAADTEGRSFHVLTTTAGSVRVSCGDETLLLGRYETALIAGRAGAYELQAADGPATALRATLPPA
jgi:mannose-6-phosphate isomerase